MICPNCQSDNRDGAKYCNECGFPLSGKIAQVAAAAVDDAEVPAEKAESSPDSESEVSDKTMPLKTVKSADEEEAAPDVARTSPSSSGPIDPERLPSIDVAGVNVDENGNAFDFSDIEQPETEGAADDLETHEFQPSRDDSGETATFSEDDERLVAADYVAPQASWRSGDTMELPRLDDQPAPRQKEYRAPDANEKKRGKGKIVAIVLVLLLALAGGAAGVTYQLEMWGGKMLPNVVGRTQSDATSLLEQKGFKVRAMQVKSDETEGIVLLMDPGAGARQEEGTEVVIHVSIARTIPAVVGIQRDEALQLLEDAGFEKVEVITQKTDEPEGIVLAVTPEAETKAKASAVITLTVAVPYVVPDIANMSWDEAVAALEAEGFVVQSAYVYDDSVKDGTLLGTSPAAGEKVSAGATVTINISTARGAELEAAAQSYLSSVGSINSGDADFVIESVGSVAYQGNEIVSFTVVGHAVTTADVMGEKVSVTGSSREASGTLTFEAGTTNVIGVSLS